MAGRTDTAACVYRSGKRFEKLINQSTPNSAQEFMEKTSTFPLVYMQKGKSANRLHGYAYEMDVANIRDNRDGARRQS